MTDNPLAQPAVLQLLFRPKQEKHFEPLERSTRQVTVEVEPAVFVRGRLYPAQRNSPAILFFHGNGESAADYDYIAQFYTGLNISLLVIDYRGYGASDGTPTAWNILSDAVTVFSSAENIFTANQLNPIQLYVMGRSLGSAAAIEVALQAEDKLAGLIIESGFADTKTLLNCLGKQIDKLDEEQDAFRNAVKISQITTRTLILHGAEDRLLLPFEAQKLYSRSAAEDKRIVMIEGADHNTIMIIGISTGNSPYFKAIRQFVNPCN